MYKKIIGVGVVGGFYWKYRTQEYIMNADKLMPKYQNKQEKIIKRDDVLAQLEQKQYDIMVIGGGASGAGVALEAATRGYKCLLIEQDDFASGASSKSTKLIHGGVRYLAEAFEFSLKGYQERKEKIGLVKEALNERTYFIENAQYMNKYIPIVIPLENIFSVYYYYTGVLKIIKRCQYSTSVSTCPWPYIVGKQQLKMDFPNLKDVYKYGIIYYDGQMNDSRMNIEIIKTSQIENYIEGFEKADVLNYMKFVKFEKNENGQIIGGVIKNKDDKEYKIKANCVVNCTGCFSDQIRLMDDKDQKKRIQPVEGTHLILPLKQMSKKKSILIPKTKDGRVLFMTPWQKNLLVGTTDNKYDQPDNDPIATYDNLLYLFKEMNTYIDDIKVDDLKSKFCGLRPLVLNENSNGNSASIARTHVIEQSKSGLFSLMGGKWTTYRIMAEETMDQISEFLAKQGIQQKNKVSTKYLNLIGSLQNKDQYKKQLKELYALDKQQANHLVKAYGQNATKIFQICKENEEYSQKLHKEYPYIKAEIIYMIRYELAQNAQDILLRRMRIGFQDSKAMFDCLQSVVNLFGVEKGWNQDQIQIQYQFNKEQLLQKEF